MAFWGCGARLPALVRAGFAGSTRGHAPPGAAAGPAAAPCLLLPKYRSRSVQPGHLRQVPSHGRSRPRGGTGTLGHLGPARALLRCTSWGCSVSPAVVVPWGCGTWRCHNRCWRCHRDAGSATRAPSSCPPLVPRGLTAGLQGTGVLGEVFVFPNLLL